MEAFEQPVFNYVVEHYRVPVTVMKLYNRVQGISLACAFTNLKDMDRDLERGRASISAQSLSYEGKNNKNTICTHHYII